MTSSTNEMSRTPYPGSSCLRILEFPPNSGTVLSNIEIRCLQLISIKRLLFARHVVKRPSKRSALVTNNMYVKLL